jgi:hypothetical protein
MDREATESQRTERPQSLNGLRGHRGHRELKGFELRGHRFFKGFERTRPESCGKEWRSEAQFRRQIREAPDASLAAALGSALGSEPHGPWLCGLCGL